MGFGSFALTLLEHCWKAVLLGSPLHHFSLFSLLLPPIALQPLDFGRLGVCAGYFMFVFCVFLLASSSRSPSDVPSFLRGPRVRPVAWPWRPGSSSGLPPRPYVAEPLTNGLEIVEVMTSYLYFSKGQKGGVNSTR